MIVTRASVSNCIKLLVALLLMISLWDRFILAQASLNLSKLAKMTLNSWSYFYFRSTKAGACIITHGSDSAGDRIKGLLNARWTLYQLTRIPSLPLLWGVFPVLTDNKGKAENRVKAVVSAAAFSRLLFLHCIPFLLGFIQCYTV